MNHKVVLIIEDDFDITQALQILLEAEGYKVHTAENGEDGLRVLDTLPFPCLILVDFFMPVMDGQEFLTRLKEHRGDTVAALPIVVMSAAARHSQVEKIAADFGRAFIKKPIDIETLLKLVSSHCKE